MLAHRFVCSSLSVGMLGNPSVAFLTIVFDSFRSFLFLCYFRWNPIDIRILLKSPVYVTFQYSFFHAYTSLILATHADKLFVRLRFNLLLASNNSKLDGAVKIIIFFTIAQINVYDTHVLLKILLTLERSLQTLRILCSLKKESYLDIINILFHMCFLYFISVIL